MNFAHHSSDRLWLLLLWGAAILLFCIDLNGVPLRDWDEGTVAQVAREISRGEAWSAWLHPQLWGQPYLNKPPLMHGLIAGAFQLLGVQTWTARLPGALLSATSVPLLYLLGREIFPTRLFALMGASVYLTLLPVARHSRLAMLDGAVVCFFIALLWLLMRSRRHPSAYLGVGLCFALMGLTKGILGGLAAGDRAPLFAVGCAQRTAIALPVEWLAAGQLAGSRLVCAAVATLWPFVCRCHAAQPKLGAHLGLSG